MSGTELATQFADVAERLFGDLATAQVIESAEGGEFPRSLWDAAEASGMFLALVSEAQGGIGATLPDAAALTWAAGKHAVPGPFAEMLLANHFLALAGLEPTARPVALAFVEAVAGDELPRHIPRVAWFGAAQEVVLVEARAGNPSPARICRVSPTDFDRSALVDVDGEPHDALMAKPQATTEWHPVGGMTGALCLQHAAVLRASQMVGAMQWCLDRTVGYALERKQFGRQIGQFQVIQQMIAELASATVACRAAADAAIADPSNALLVATARSRLGDGVDTVCGVAHQVHGAIGFSYEYALHFRTRRLMAWRDDWGTTSDWRRVLASAFLGLPADAVWPALSAARPGAGTN